MRARNGVLTRVAFDTRNGPPMPATDRPMNFNAGPAALPRTVLERCRDELLDFDGSGLSVMEHITGLRLDKARDMLRDPENQLKIADISAACGFDDPSTFSRLFRRRFSCQPRETRVRPN